MKDRWVDRFIKEAVPKILDEISPYLIIIFGSRVKGNARDDSDIDVIVVSDYFKGIPFLKRMPMLLKLVKFEKHIDFLCYTEEEFNRIKNESIVLKTALQNGVSIYSHKKRIEKLKNDENE